VSPINSRAADNSASPLELVGIELADGRLRIVHAMVTRSSYHDLYEEAKKWRQ
jgi:hypothetical protein